MNQKRIQQVKCLFTVCFLMSTMFYGSQSYASAANSNNESTVGKSERVVSKGQQKNNQGVSDEDSKKTTIQGVVKDASGNSVIGAAVMVKGTTNGVTTDLDGRFTLTIPAPAAEKVLVIDCLGYDPQEIVVGNRSQFEIIMQEESLNLEGTVVTALGIKRQEKALSYSVQQIKADEITAVKDANFMNSLVGKVAGVQINSGAQGPGGATRVVMRGEKSIEKGNNALYVIDGIPMFNNSFGGDDGPMSKVTGSESAADINPEDIESINMLTGPSAAALYGSDAANGVIIINTKKGSKDRTTLTVSNSTTFSKVTMLPEMQNSYVNSGGYMNWGEQRDFDFDPSKFFNTGANVINSVSLSTGNAKNQTYLSVQTTNAIGVVPNNTYNRYNFTARNTTVFANDKLTLDLGASFVIQNDKNMVSQGKYYNPLPALYLFPRGEDFNEIRLFERWDPVRGYMTQYWPYSEGGHDLQNPYWIQNRIHRGTDKNRYMLNASLKWDITDWMNLTGRVRVDNSEYRMLKKFYASTLKTFAGPNGGYEDTTQHDYTLYTDIMLNIDKRFGDDWTLTANLGASLNDQRSEMAGVAGDLLLTNHFAMNNINYKANFKPLQEGFHDQNQALFASVEVGWKSLLYLTVTGRNDWASQLAFSKNASFFYPSVGLSAIVSNMVELPEWFSYLKVRGSYSQVASAFSRYLSNPPYEFNPQTHNWEKPSTFPAYDLKPEDTKSWEIGMTARFFKDFSIDATYYRSNTYHQTIYAPLPSSSGYKNVVVQTGNVQNQGLELALGYNHEWGDFSWGSSYTLTLNRNKIVSLADDAVNPITGEPFNQDMIEKAWLGSAGVAPQVQLHPGGSMTDIYINKELKRDLNGQIAVDPGSGNLGIVDTEWKKAGQLSPRYMMGWSNNFGYKGLDLGFVITARLGGKVYSATQGILDYYGASKVTGDARDNGGVPVNFGTVPAEKYYTAVATDQGGYGAYYLYDATNVRLQEMSLNYTLPKKWFKDKAKLTVGFIAKNLFMIYCKAPFDPELSASTSSAYYQGVDYFMQPATRNFGFNVKLQF